MRHVAVDDLFPVAIYVCPVGEKNHQIYSYNAQNSQKRNEKSRHGPFVKYGDLGDVRPPWKHQRVKRAAVVHCEVTQM